MTNNENNSERKNIEKYEMIQRMSMKLRKCFNHELI